MQSGKEAEKNKLNMRQDQINVDESRSQAAITGSYLYPFGVPIKKSKYETMTIINDSILLSLTPTSNNSMRAKAECIPKSLDYLKLTYGVVFSLKNMIINKLSLSNVKSDHEDNERAFERNNLNLIEKGFFSFETGEYKLYYLETNTKFRILLTTSKDTNIDISNDGDKDYIYKVLFSYYKNIIIPYLILNPMYDKNHIIRVYKDSIPDYYYQNIPSNQSNISPLQPPPPLMEAKGLIINPKFGFKTEQYFMSLPIF